MRSTMIALAFVVFMAGSLAVVMKVTAYNRPPTNSQPNPSPFFRDGARIAVPKAARVTMRSFINDAVLRDDLAAAWKESTGVVHGGLTLKQWMTGTIPVTPFDPGDTVITPVKVVESRANRVWFELLVTSKELSASGSAGGEFFCQLVPRNGGWIVSYWGQKGWNPPIPASGTG